VPFQQLGHLSALEFGGICHSFFLAGGCSRDRSCALRGFDPTRRSGLNIRARNIHDLARCKSVSALGERDAVPLCRESNELASLDWRGRSNRLGSVWQVNPLAARIVPAVVIIAKESIGEVLAGAKICRAAI